MQFLHSWVTGMQGFFNNRNSMLKGTIYMLEIKSRLNSRTPTLYSLAYNKLTAACCNI